MKMDSPFACIERCEECAAMLSAIADRATTEAEIDAIEFAKNALLFVATRQVPAFMAFIEEMNRGLSPEKKAQLKRLGIDVDSEASEQ